MYPHAEPGLPIDAIPDWAADYVGKPFKDRAQGPDAFDCWGLVRHVLEHHFGLKHLPDYTGLYKTAKDPHVTQLLAVEREQGNWLAVDAPRPGDVIVMRVTGRPWHVGILVAKGRMLHVDRSSHACIEYLESERWRGRIDGYYRNVALA